MKIEDYKLVRFLLKENLSFLDNEQEFGWHILTKNNSKFCESIIKSRNLEPAISQRWLHMTRSAWMYE